MIVVLRSFSATYENSHTIGEHGHAWGQLVYAARGAVSVVAAGQAWLIPSARAVWLPAGTRHSLRMRGTTALRTLYVPTSHSLALPPVPLGIAVSPLLRELILQLVHAGPVEAADQDNRILFEALTVMLSRAERLKLALTMPTDPRALRVATAILADPASSASLDDLAAMAAASLRTLQRLFRAQTGLSLAHWRQVARLAAACARLLDGGSVTEAASEAGYAGVSAFTHAFRGALGQTPSLFRGKS